MWKITQHRYGECWEDTESEYKDTLEEVVDDLKEMNQSNTHLVSVEEIPSYCKYLDTPM